MKILIFGSGSIAKRHLNNLKLLGYNNIIVFKRKFDKDFEKIFNVKVVTSYDDVLLNNLDCVFICTPTSIHLEALEFANKMKLHVFIEKPMVHDYDNLNLSKNAWLNNDKVFFIGYMLRFHQSIKNIYDIITSKKFGNVYSARFEFGSYLPNWHPNENYKNSYASKKELGGGVVRTISHEIDLVQYFFGNPIEIKTVNFNTGILKIDVEELSESILLYNDKIVTIHLDLLQKKYHRTISILFDEARLDWNWQTNEILISKNLEEIEIIKPNYNFELNDLYINELKHFFYLINNNIFIHSLDFQHALSNTELMLKIYNNG